MGILDNLTGLAGGGQGAGSLAAQAIAMLTSNESGGLAGLVQQFTAAGLGDHVSSWVGTGQNLPISPEQIIQGLGQGRVSQLAAAAGIQPEHAAGQLAQLLPGLIDHLTPNGSMPSGGSLLTQAASLLSALTAKG